MTNDTNEWLRKEIQDRLAYFYKKTDGSYDFPNSAEGDLLKMVLHYFQGEEDV